MSQGHGDTDVGEGKVAARHREGTATPDVLSPQCSLWGLPWGPGAEPRSQSTLSFSGNQVLGSHL